MRCKVCGAYNEDYLEYCENCAAPLEPDAAPSQVSARESAGAGDEPSAWGFVRSPSWPKPDFDANTVSESDVPEAYLNRFNPRPVERAQEAGSAPVESAPVYPSNAYEETVYEKPPVSRFNASEPSAERRNAPVCGPTEDGEIDVPPPVTPRAAKPKRAEPVDYGYTNKRRRKASRAKSPVLLWGVASVLVLLIAVLLFALLGNGSGLFSKSSITKPAVIELKSADAAKKEYYIHVYAKNGSRVRFTAGPIVRDGDDMIVSGGIKSMLVSEDIFLPTEPVDAPTVEIFPDVVVIGKDGVTEEKVTFDKPIVIQLPTIELTLTSPTSPLSATTPEVAVAGTVSDNMASVFIGEQQLTVDETGSFSGTYTLSAEGASTLSVEARKNGYQIARQTIEVNYTPASANPTSGTPVSTTPAVPVSTGTPAFEFSSSLNRRTTDAGLTVSGTVQKGAALSVEGVDLASPMTVNEAAGTFSFTVKMDNVGLYVPTVTSNLNGVTGTRTLYLERSHADKNAYMEKVYVLDYQYLKDSPFHKQGYKITGKVTEILQTSPFVIAKIQTTSGDLLFYYYSGISTVDASDGKTYSVYADPNGKDEATGLPIVYCWYILKS